MPRQSITFTPPNDAWLNAHMESEEYGTKSELVNDLIRRARHQESEIEAIRAELIKAEESGFTKRTGEDIRQAARKELEKDGLL